MQEWLIGKTQSEIRQVVTSLGLPAYTAAQITQWIYQKRVTRIDQMTNLSKVAREALSQTYTVGGFDPVAVQQSADGTRKYVFPTLSGGTVEAVMIPAEETAAQGRATLCISSQVGCAMNCKFCMTGRMGFVAQLSAGEIIGQFLRVQESEALTNVVYMGMGEPLNNYEAVRRSIEIFTASWGLAWSPKRITLSTVGILKRLEAFMQQTQVHLAVSLHNPFPSQRAELMPVQQAFPLHEVIAALRTYDFSGQRRLSFEYTLFDGWNDTPRHANALLQLLRGLECRINLIRFHPIPHFDLRPSRPEVVAAFQNRLAAGGARVTLRASRGLDIMAACGMLSTKEKEAPCYE